MKPIDERLSFVDRIAFRTRRPSFVDAIDLLRAEGHFQDGDAAIIKAKSLDLPSGETVAFLAVAVDWPSGPVVFLPTCAAVRASNTYSLRQAYDPTLLDSAALDEFGNITTKCGLHLHSGEVTAVNLSVHWDQRKAHVIEAAIAFRKAQEKCYAQIAWNREADRVDYRPVLSSDPAYESLAFVINYGAVGKLRLAGRGFKAFLQFYDRHTLREDRLSQYSIESALYEAGVRDRVSSPASTGGRKNA